MFISSAHPSRARARFRAVVAATLAFVSLAPCLLAGSPVFADAGLTIKPVSTAGGPGRTSFVYSLRPGDRLQDAVVVGNLADAALTAFIYVANAFTTPTGAIGIKANQATKTDAVNWVKFTSKLKDGKFDFEPKTQATVPFSVNVPADAIPGDYVIGLATVPQVSAPAPKPGTDVVTVVTAIAVTMTIRVKGKLNPSVRVESLKVSDTPKYLPFVAGGSTKVSMNIINNGNQLLAVSVRITEQDLLGNTIHVEPKIELKKLLPGAGVQLKRRWKQTPAVMGSIKVVVTTDAGFSVTRRETFWSVGWQTLAVPGGILLLLALWWYKRRRGRRVDATSDPQGAKGSDPA